MGTELEMINWCRRHLLLNFLFGWSLKYWISVKVWNLILEMIQVSNCILNVLVYVFYDDSTTIWHLNVRCRLGLTLHIRFIMKASYDITFIKMHLHFLQIDNLKNDRYVLLSSFSILCVDKFLRSKLSSEFYRLAVKISNHYY